MSAPGDQVSVVVPFYRPGARLADALASIAASTHAHMDVWLIDDAADSVAVAAAEAAVARDPRFRLLRNPVNRGVSFARNRGLDAAGGDFILFVDADDRIGPDWIAGLVRDARARAADVTIGRSRRVLDGVARPYPMAGLNRRGPLAFRDIVFKDNAVVWNKLYAAAWLRGTGARFDESLTIGEDLLFNYQALRAARRIYVSDAGCYDYHADQPASIMRGSDAARRAEQFARLLARLSELDRAPGPRHPGALRKVARDLLIQRRRAHGACALTPTERAQVRAIDPWLPLKVRLSFWRKAIRGRLTGG